MGTLSELKHVQDWLFGNAVSSVGSAPRLSQPSKFLRVKQEEEELQVTAIGPGKAAKAPPCSEFTIAPPRRCLQSVCFHSDHCAPCPACPPAPTESSLQAALHQSIFLSAMSAQPGRDLSLCWEQHRKLLPGVVRETAETVQHWSVQQVSVTVWTGRHERTP